MNWQLQQPKKNDSSLLDERPVGCQIGEQFCAVELFFGSIPADRDAYKFPARSVSVVTYQVRYCLLDLTSVDYFLPIHNVT